MQKTVFILKELSIQKMPGFPKGLETYKKLAPHINIIAGPNASGKSSTARIIQQMIWRNQTNGIQAESSIEVDKESWEIKIDSGNIILQRDGKDDEFVGLPAVEESSRYMLALHDLVKEDDDELARQIVRESVGGYDLEKAQENLGYTDVIKNRGTSEFKNYESAEKKYKGIQQKQKELKHEEERLVKLYKTKALAEEAYRLHGLYEIVDQYLQAKLKLDQLSEEYERFPKVLDKATGEEYSDIIELEKDIEATEDAIKIAKNELINNEDTLSKLNLSNSGVNKKVLNELEERVEHLTKLEREIQDAKNKIAGFNVKEYEALKSIDKNLDSSEWKNIDLEEVSGLNEFLLSAHQTISEKQFLETGINELKKEENEKTPKSELLNEGIRSLSYWLQEQGSNTGLSKLWLGVLSVTGILTVITTYFFGWPGLLGIVVIILLTIYAYGTRRPNQSNLRDRDYNKTGLKSPEVWNTAGVSGKLKELLETLQEAKWQEKIKQKIATHNNGLDALQERLNQIHQTRDEWLKKIKTVPNLPENNLKNYSELYWFLIHVKEWGKNNAEAEALNGTKGQLSKALAETLKRINQLFIESKAEEATDGTTAKVILKKLKEDEGIRQDAVAEIDHQEKHILEKNEQKNRVVQKMQSIYNKLKTEYGKKEEIWQFTEQLEDYKKVKEDYQVAERLLSEKQNLIKNHSLFESNKEDIETISLDQAQSKKKRFENEANELEGINREITEIETNINNTKKGHDLEDALTKWEEALNDLEQLYENNLSSITGKLIIDQLKKETREQNRPKVFKRANEIFNRITNGRYELKLEERDEPSFKAFDTVLKFGQNLSELSTGTRIQLLLSVRLAFIETQEPSIKLPILADELLANSDDIRAKAIIEALVEISKQGRQVFYFTAQTDEVAKWKKYLDAIQNISYEIIELTGRQNETIKYNTNDVDFSSLGLLQNNPAPGDKSHEEYGKSLQVPSFNLLTDEAEQLHLWYLVEDNDLLCKCFLKGIKFWGQLESFIKYNGKIEELDEETMISIEAKLKFLRRFQELYRRGRSRPIDREILEQAGAVSHNFIEEVAAKLKELDGNPQELIESLKNGDVSGFRSNKTEELEQYLISEGYIDNKEALGKDAILVQLNAFLSNLALDTSETESFINGVLGS